MLSQILCSRLKHASVLRFTSALFLAASVFAVFLSPSMGDTTSRDKTKEKKQSKAEAEASVIALIREARNAEMNGNNERRKELLDQAAGIAGTSNPTLNSLRGLFFDGNQWRRPETVTIDPKYKATLEEYRRLRDGSPDRVQTWIELAKWCQLNGLVEESRANLMRVLVADPENTMARRALGYVQINERWVSPEQMSREIEAIRAALNRFTTWEKCISKIGKFLSKKASWEKGISQLRAIDDPNVITAVEVILGNQSEAIALEAIDSIARFNEREAGESLLRFALDSPWSSCRDRAVDHLRNRDWYEVIPQLIGMLETPVSSAVMILPDSRGNLLYRHVFKQEGIDRDFIRQLDNYYVELNQEGLLANESLPVSVNQTAPVWLVGREVRRSVAQKSVSLEAQKEQYNANLAVRNRRIQELLSRLTGEEPGSEAKDWMQWWFDQNQVKVYEKSVAYRRIENYQPVYSYYDQPSRPESSPRPRPRLSSQGSQSEVRLRSESLGGRSCECFIAGTLVTTAAGLVPIEAIRTGDRVLSRNTENGQLEFRAVIHATVRELTPTLKIKIGNEVFQCSKGHPFWVADYGWVRAGELKVGQRISCLDGSQLIDALEDGDNQVLYNLVVDTNACYFVGEARLLCHDNTIQQKGSRTISNRLTR